MNIIGGGPLKNALEREILRLRLENNLFLHDHLNESAIDKFYQSSDAFLLRELFVRMVTGMESPMSYLRLCPMGYWLWDRIRPELPRLL